MSEQAGHDYIKQKNTVWRTLSSKDKLKFVIFLVPLVVAELILKKNGMYEVLSYRCFDVVEITNTGKFYLNFNMRSKRYLLSVV